MMVVVVMMMMMKDKRTTTTNADLSTAMLRNGFLMLYEGMYDQLRTLRDNCIYSK
jgi:hypothetical protein